MTIVFIILAALIGAALGEEAGLVAGAAIGFLIGRWQVARNAQSALESRLNVLTERLKLVEQELAAPLSVATAPDQIIGAELETAPLDPSAPSFESAPLAGRSSQIEHAATASPAAVVPEPPAPPLAAFFDRLIARIVGFFTTGNIVAKVGVIVLFFGFAFLIRLASESGMLPLELRLVAVAIGGFALVVVGWRLRQRKPEYAVIVQGGGVGVLYLVIFAAARLYHLMPMSLAFALMVILVAASAALAVLQNAPALAVLGVSGGFLAPVLTSTGHGSHVALFSYYALLNAGILGIAWFRPWRWLNLVGFVFTYAIGSLWGARYYQSSFFASVEPFVILSFLFYLALPLLYSVRQPANLRGLVDGSLVFGNPIVFFTIQNQLVDEFEFGRAFSALALGAVYAVITFALWRRDPARMRLLAEAFLAMAALFATLAIPFAFDGHWTAAAWSLEGAGVVWVGLRQRRYLAQAAGLALQVCAALLFFIDAPMRLGPAPAVDTTVLGAAMIALAALFTALRIGRDRAHAVAFIANLDAFMLGWALLWWFGAMGYELERQFEPKFLYSAMTIGVALSGLALAELARRLEWTLGALPALGVLPLGAVFVAAKFGLNVHAAPWADGGWLAWPALLAAAYILLWRYCSHWPRRLIVLSHAGSMYFALFTLTWLSAHLTARITFLGDAWTVATCGLVSVIFVQFLSAVRLPAVWPLRVSASAYRHAGLAPAVALLGAWLLVNAANDGAPSPLSYIPLANPLELVAIAALLAALAWWRRLARDGVAIPDDGRAFAIIFAAAVFIALNTTLLRSMHHYYDIPYRATALWRSPAVQAALSLAWATLGSLAMALAARRSGRREHWIVGAGLLGLVVLKLFLIDLAGSGAVARIVSFLGVGVVCLVIGYLAPIPPRPQQAPVA